MSAKFSRRRIPVEIRKAYNSLQESADSILKELEDLEIRKEEALKNAVKEFDTEKEGLLQQLSKMKRAMNIIYPEKQNAYDAEASWKEKTIWVLKQTDRLLPISSIVTKIRENEDNVDSALNPMIRLTVKRMVDKDEIIKYEDANLSSIHYGLPEWFSNGNLLEAYYF